MSNCKGHGEPIERGEMYSISLGYPDFGIIPTLVEKRCKRSISVQKVGIKHVRRSVRSSIQICGFCQKSG